MTSLTPRQRDVLLVIYALSRQTGAPPSYLEMMRALGFASTNAISIHLRACRKKGYLTCRPRANRTYVLTPEGRAALLGPAVPCFPGWEERARLVPVGGHFRLEVCWRPSPRAVDAAASIRVQERGGR